MSSSYDPEPNVTLIATLSGTSEFPSLSPDKLVAIGAMGCFSQYSSVDLAKADIIRKVLWERESIQKKYPNMAGIPASEIKKAEDGAIRHSFLVGHGSVGDQTTFTYCIEGITRAATIFLCAPEYLAHEQQSFRRTKANRFYLSQVILDSDLSDESARVLSESYELYTKLSAVVPPEDARNLLPLYALTNIQTTGNARELNHLLSMSRRPSVPYAVHNVVEDMLAAAREVAPISLEETPASQEVLAWYPSSQFYSEKNKTLESLIPDEPEVVFLGRCGIALPEETIKSAIEAKNEADLAMLKHMHYTFLAPMSLSAWHQSTRNKTLNHVVESIYSAAERRCIVIPPKIRNSPHVDAYLRQNTIMLDLYRDLVLEGVPKQEAIGVIPHSLQIWDLMHVNGWNAIGFVGHRTCIEAQWEIRGVAQEIANKIKSEDPGLGNYVRPKAMNYRYCSERKPCKSFTARQVCPVSTKAFDQSIFCKV